MSNPNLFGGPVTPGHQIVDDVKPLPNVMTRTEVINRLNQIGEVFTLSMKSVL